MYHFYQYTMTSQGSHMNKDKKSHEQRQEMHTNTYNKS